jgi:hypothetical protein
MAWKDNVTLNKGDGTNVLSAFTASLPLTTATVTPT